MQPLAFPRPYAFTTRTIDSRREILDPLRQQYVALTPEEWVRQNLVQFLIHDRGHPRGLMATEKFLARYLLISNGVQHYCYAIDRDREEYTFLDHLPHYSDL